MQICRWTQPRKQGRGVGKGGSKDAVAPLRFGGCKCFFYCVATLVRTPSVKYSHLQHSRRIKASSTLLQTILQGGNPLVPIINILLIRGLSQKKLTTVSVIVTLRGGGG